MPRNLDRRVEAMVPVEDEQLRQRVDEILAVSLADDSLAWTLTDDTWERGDRSGTLETHLELQQQALKRAAVDLR
jgi:polyphosphate kinase